MLILKNISKSFSDKKILNKVSFSLGQKEVVGLVGKNGTGKSTLFKIIMKELQVDEGEVHMQGDTLGYLPQNPDFSGVTVEEFLSARLTEDYLYYKVDIVLEKVGLTSLNRKQLCSTLSGGQKTRLYLASLLLSEPESSVLLLDEPTNNLDLQALEWLEDFINTFNGSVLLVSHDRYFLDKTVDKIIELEDASLTVYGGSYSFYQQKKLEEQELELKRYEANLAEIQKLERLIIEKRNRVQELSTQKRVDNDKFAHTFFMERATKKVSRGKKAMETQLVNLPKLEKPKVRKIYELGFNGETHQGKLLVSTDRINKDFDLKPVLKNINLEIRGNEHVWLSGTNGSGKTTLLDILVGSVSADSGTVKWGNDVNFGYFSQHSSLTDSSNTGIQELMAIGANPTSCYNLASHLHLTEKDLKRPINKLSRGQITKLEFIKLLMGNNHLLILDEPTNHLEVETREEIEFALKDYKGAILVASHDRYFIEEIKISRQLKLEDGQLKQT